MKKRILSIILAVCMLLSIAPITMAADTAYGDLQKGDIIEFGSYPQTKEVNPKIISALNDILTDDMWVSYDYYIGTGTEYDGNMTASDYMKYADLELNGEKYRAVRFSQYRPAVTSDVSSETTSIQDNNGYELNTTYFFKYEPLTWTVLDPDEGFVMSNISIDSQAFENFSYYDPDSYDSAAGQAVYNSKDCKYLANDWSKCSLREWMNKDFYNTAFTSEEQAQIGKTYLDNTNPFSQKYDSAGTFDKIFTISFYDAINSDYGFNEDGSSTDFARARPATDYAKCQGADAADTTGTLPYWWLRTTGLFGAFGFGVSPNGWIVSSGGGYYNVNRTDNAVVPAFKFNPKTPTLAKGSKIEFGSYPQSEVTDADEIAKLEADSENYLWVSYKYYSGTGDQTNGKMEPGDFMLYKDFYSDGEMFRAVTFTEYRPGNSGGVKEKVYSFQGKNGYNPNNVYYFKYEPLTWRVLDPDEGYIMCDNIIDSQAYQNFVIKKDDKLYNSKDCTNYVSDWSTSSLRQWLNKTFYNTAFSIEEKKLIGTTFLENNSADGTWFGTDTGDKIFVLSYNDAVNSAYGFNSSNEELDEARKLKGTAYSNCQGLYIDDDGIAWWWLRTPDDSDKVDLVSCYGWTAPGQGVYGTGMGVVPALKFNPKAVDVSVVYDLDGGAWAEGYTAPISYKSDETLALPTAENVVRAGYIFGGWEQTSFMNKTVAYTAKWIANGYTVKFNSDGGTAVSDKSLAWGDKVLDGVAAPTKAGYTFTGWKLNDSAVSADTKYSDLAANDKVSEITLIAEWTANSYTVKFDSNGGTAVSDKSLAWGDKVLDGVSAPTKAGYTFAGWKLNDSAVTADAKYSDLAADDKVSEITLTAEWMANGYTVKFDSNGGTAVSDKSLAWGDKVLDGVSAPTKAGYIFAGWKFSSLTVTANTKFSDLAADDKVSEITLTAEWMEKTYTIKFDTRGGTPVADKTLHWNDKVLDGVVPPTRDGGFEFIGWNIVSPKLSATTLNCTYGELVQDDSIDTVTLGAVWRDTEAPIIIGLENGKTYCGAQKFRVTDNDTSRSAIVMINGDVVEPDADGYYTAEPANGELKIIAVDSFANMFMVTITVNASHDYSDWKFDENEHWKECKYGDSVIEKGEHTFEWVTDKEATETETGIAHEECSVCHAKRNENTEVSKLPTKWDNIRDWFVSIIAKIIKWFIDLIGDVC